MCMQNTTIKKNLIVKKNEKKPEEQMKMRRQISIAQYLMDNPHRNIVTFKIVDSEGENKFNIKMEEGKILDAQNVCSLPLVQKIYFILDCCEALTYLAEHGIQHRDVKTENWVYFGEGKDKVFKLIDFGLAKMHTLPSLLEQRLKVGKSMRQSIVNLNNMNQKSTIADPNYNIGVTLNSLGNLKLSPPEYEPDCLQKIESHILLIGKTDSWYFGIQLVRTLFDLSTASNINLRKIIQEERDNIVNSFQYSTTSKNAGIELRKIFLNHTSKQQLFPGKNQFALQFLRLIQGFFIFDQIERLSPKVFALNFIKIIKKYEILPQKDFQQLELRYSGFYQSDMERLIMLKIWLNQELEKPNNQKSTNIIKSVIENQENYIAQKHTKKKTNFKDIDLILSLMKKKEN